jgi:acetoin utilization protein AcuB
MTRECYCVSPEDRLPAVYESMRAKGFEGLPVASEGKVVGVVTLWDVLNRLARTDNTEDYLRNTPVRDVMTDQPITIHEDEIIEEAALLMFNNDINILPVVNDEEQVVGILAQSDFLKIFVEVLGIRRKGTRITLRVEDRVGELARVTEIVKNQGVSIISAVTFESPGHHMDIVLRVATTEAKPVVDSLVANGLRVTHVSQVWA